MQRVATLLALCLPAFLLMVGVGMIVALLPQRVYALTGTLESVGMIASIFAMAYVLTQFPVGLLSDRFGTKPFLITGFFLCGTAGLVFFSAQSAFAIYLGRVIQGIGEAPLWALGPAVLSLAYPDTKGRAIGIYNATIHAGLTLGPLLGLVVAPTGQSNLPFLLFAALCFAGGLIISVLLPRGARVEPPRRTGRGGIRRLARLSANKRISMVLGGILLFGAAYGSFLTVLPISLAISKGFGSQATSVLFALFYASVSVSQLVAGYLSDRLGRGGFMIGGFLLAAAGLAVFPLVPGLWTFGPLTLASLGLGMFGVASLADLNDRVPSNLKGAVSGSYYLAWGLGYVLGPLGIGYLGAIAPNLGFYLLAAIICVQGVVIWRSRE